MSISTKSDYIFNPFTGILIIILLVPAIFYSTTRSMIDIWIVNETFTHGFLIFPISLWLIWQKKYSIFRSESQPEPRVFILLLPILALWFVSYIVEVQIVQQISMVALIPIIIWILFGRSILVSIIFPISFLIFAIPLGQSLIPPLMEFTANFTVTLVHLTGIPIYQDGLYFTLPSGNWSVVEECSGVRYLIASIALGSLYAYTSYRSKYKRLIFIFFAILLPVFANGLRAFGIVMIGHFSGMTLATGVDHLLYGWLFFGIVIFIMFYIGSFWWDPVEINERVAKRDALVNNIENRQKLTISVLAIGILFVFTKTLAYQVTQSSRDFHNDIALTLPENFEGWQHNKDFSTGWSPIIENPDQSIEKSYRFGSDFVQLNIAFYAYQRQGAEAVSSYNRITNPLNGRWKLIHSSDLKESNFYVNENEIRQGEHKLLIWKWYRIGSRLTPNPYIAKILSAYNQIFTGRNDSSMITLATTLDIDKSDSRSRLRSFNQEALPQIYFTLDKLTQ